MFHNFLINENKKIQESEKIFNIPTKEIMPQYTNINKEIKKRTNDLRKFFNIKNTIFKEMQSKQNSLTYKEFMSYFGKYFFGPNGVVTEKYKFLRDYYEALNLKIGLNNRIYTGTLDYFFLFSNHNSYSQRLNSTKQKLLSLSNNLSVASNHFDKIIQKARMKTKYLKNNKNFIHLNIKNSFSVEKNIKKINKKNINKNNQKIKKNLKKQIFEIEKNNSLSFLIKDKSLSENNQTNINKTNDNTDNLFNSNTHSDNEESNKTERIIFDRANITNFFEKKKIDKKIVLKLKKMHINNKNKTNYRSKKSKIFLTPNNSLTNSINRNSFINYTRYSKKPNKNIFKYKLRHIKSNDNIYNISNFSFSYTKNKDKIYSENKDIDEAKKEFFIGNIKDTLKEKINPILFLSQNSQKKLSYIKNHLKSKNDNKIKNIMRKKSLMGILIDKEFFKNMKRLSVPKYIELPKNFQDKKKFYE